MNKTSHDRFSTFRRRFQPGGFAQRLAVMPLLFAALVTACGETTPETAAPGETSSGGAAGGTSGGADNGTQPQAQGGRTQQEVGGETGLAVGGVFNTGGTSGAAASAGGGGSAATNGGETAGGAAIGGGPADGAKPLWQQKQDAFLKVIGRPQVPLDAQQTPKGEAGGLVVEDFSFQSDAKTRITGTSHRPQGAGPFPAVIYLHGTGGNRSADVCSQRALANQGFFVVAIDARYHGEGLGSSLYLDAIFNNYVGGDEHPFLYDTVWDVMRLIDYLEGRPEVDKTRVGMFGRSKGGMETYLTSAVEPRIKVAVPWIGVQHWAWALDNNQWQSRVGSIQGAIDQAAQHDGVSNIDATYVRKFYDKAVPGMYKEFDAIEMLPAIAPRPLLAINGDTDARTPLGGLRLIETATQAAYAAAGASDKFMLLVQPGTGHDVTPASEQATVDWFVKYLKQ